MKDGGVMYAAVGITIAASYACGVLSSLVFPVTSSLVAALILIVMCAGIMVMLWNK